MYPPELTDRMLTEQVRVEAERRSIPMTTLLDEWVAEKVRDLERKRSLDKRRWPRLPIFYGKWRIGWEPIDPQNVLQSHERWRQRQQEAETIYRQHLQHGRIFRLVRDNEHGSKEVVYESITSPNKVAEGPVGSWILLFKDQPTEGLAS